MVRVLSGFGFYRQVSGWIAGDVILAGFVEIWPNHGEISPDLTEISPNLIEISPDLVKSGLDLDEISSDLVGSDGISSNLCRRTPNTAGFCKFSSKILRISPEVLVL